MSRSVDKKAADQYGENDKKRSLSEMSTSERVEEVDKIIDVLSGRIILTFQDGEKRLRQEKN